MDLSLVSGDQLSCQWTCLVASRPNGFLAEDCQGLSRGSSAEAFTDVRGARLPLSISAFWFVASSVAFGLHSLCPWARALDFETAIGCLFLAGCRTLFLFKDAC